MTKRARWMTAWLWLGASSLLALACSDDDVPGDAAGAGGTRSDNGAKEGAKCLSPGIGGQCMCGPGQNGTTTCGEDGTWRMCSCVTLPEGAKCREGEKLRCGQLCPGESVARMTRCVNGDYDCRCDRGDDAGS